MSDYAFFGVIYVVVAVAAGVIGFSVGRWWGAREERERCVFWSSWPAEKNDNAGRQIVFIQPPSQGLN